VTVASHVLNDVSGARVADATRARVRRTAAELSYSPNRVARGLRLQRTNTIAMISDEIATTPYAGKIVLGAQDTAHARGWTLMLLNTGGNRDLEDRELDLLDQYQVEGVLYAAMWHQVVEVPARLAGHQVVLLNARTADATPPAVVPDEHLGARVAVDELIRQGHRRIGFANGGDDIPATVGRLSGYREALKLAGIRFNSSLVVTDEGEALGGYRAVKELLARKPRPTAIFCFNDRMAMGAYRAIAEMGLRIPEDCSVVGFDNQEIVAEGLFPALTTVALPHYEMGAWAVDALIGRIEDGGQQLSGTTYPVLLPCPLVSRASIAPPVGGLEK
jgi:LacI family transcriptional regulator